MTYLQDRQANPPLQAIEIDWIVYDMQIAFETNLNWISHGYGRAYRNLEKQDKKLYFPEVYVGGETNDYIRVTPDNDKKGTFFFVVNKETPVDYEQGGQNFLTWDVGLLFWANLKEINKSLSENEVFTQHLKRDVRQVLTQYLFGKPYNIEILNVVDEVTEVYKEFKIDETQNYHKAPYDGFRFNLKITMLEECFIDFDRCDSIRQNISQQESYCLIPNIDWNDSNAFNALTDEQKNTLRLLL